MKLPDSSGLTPKQAVAAALIATGSSIVATAREVGISERQVFKWMTLDPFRAEVAALRDRLLSETVGKLSAAATAAVETLRALLDDEAAGVRLRASVAILDALVKLRELGDLAARVSELEALADPAGKRRAM